jgi:TetR/AcrR family transcriptional regulator, repressor for uid operon
MNKTTESTVRKVDPERQQAKRRKIIEAAVECFARRGFHATTTAEICASAGMSPGNLFHYFNSKDAIIEAIAEEDQRETAAVFALLETAQDVIEAVQTLAELSLVQATDPVYARISIEIAAEVTRNEKFANLFAPNEAATKAALVTLLDRGIVNGQIDSMLNPDLAATWLIALLDGAVGRAAMDPAFSSQSHAPMLRLMIGRFLRPATFMHPRSS